MFAVLLRARRADSLVNDPELHPTDIELARVARQDELLYGRLVLRYRIHVMPRIRFASVTPTLRFRLWVRSVITSLRSAWSTDEAEISKRYRRRMGRELDLRDPQTFTEKIQWLILRWRDPNCMTFADKYAVRAFVEERIGKEFLIPLVGVYDTVRSLDPDALPESFIIKATHGSGWNMIVRDKAAWDYKRARPILRQWIRRNYYAGTREWQYRDIPPRLVVEELLLDASGDIPCDFKLHCFGGAPVFIQVDHDRFKDHSRSFYDEHWQRLPFALKYKKADFDLPRPRRLEKMLDLARRLSGSWPYVRVDLYCVAERIYFGELTFTPDAGMGMFSPKEWDRRWGDLLILPSGQS